PPQSAECLQGLLFLFLDVEELVQARDLEDLVDLRIDIAEDQAALGGLHLLVQRDQLAERGAGEVLDVGEVEQDLALALLLDQIEQLIADDLNVLLVEN